jgi:lipid-A-disaccharide synthase
MTTVMVVAGEASGDALGGALVAALKQQRPDMEFIGVTGAYMQQEGVEELASTAELSVMGLAEVVPALPRIVGQLNRLVEQAEERQIAALITIDSYDFSIRLARRVKKKQGIPCIHYVSPKVWAWRPGRIRQMQGVFDHVLALFPFEPPFYKSFDVPCSFVGHPVAERLAAHVPQEPLVPPLPPKLALLPGSRESEIKRHWPLMQEAFSRLKQEIPALTAVVPLPAGREDLKGQLGTLPKGVELVMGEARFEALKNCRAALAKCGTGNLELAMLGVPMVVGYKLAPLTYAMARLIMPHPPYISPINWVLNARQVPEFVQGDFRVDKVLPPLRKLLLEEEAWNRAAQTLATCRKALTTEGAATRAAAIVLQTLGKIG